MKIFVILLLSLSIEVYSLDCKEPIPSLDEYWLQAESIVYGRIIKVEYREADNGVGELKYTLAVHTTIKGMKENTVEFKDLATWQMFRPGEKYIVFLNPGKEVDFCGPNQEFDFAWFSKENKDRADLPRELMRKVNNAIRGNP